MNSLASRIDSGRTQSLCCATDHYHGTRPLPLINSRQSLRVACPETAGNSIHSRRSSSEAEATKSDIRLRRIMRRTEANESIIVYTCSFLAENRGNQVVIARGFTGEELIHHCSTRPCLWLGIRYLVTPEVSKHMADFVRNRNIFVFLVFFASANKESTAEAYIFRWSVRPSVNTR